MTTDIQAFTKKIELLLSHKTRLHNFQIERFSLKEKHKSISLKWFKKRQLTKMIWTFYFDARVHELQKSDSLEFCWKTFIINFSGIGIIQSKSFEEYWQITGSGRPRLQMEGNNIIFFLEQERWKFYSWCETYIGQNILWKSLVNSRLNTWVRTRNCKIPPRTSICMSF